MASFRGPRFFLSNFYPATVALLVGPVFPTSEHAYVWHKFLEPADQALIEMAPTAKDAKRLGGRRGGLTQRGDWDLVKLEVMRKVVLLKFRQHEDLRLALCATGNEPLIEENEWGDRYWGTCNGVGENWLGKVLMEVREQLRRDALAELTALGQEIQPEFYR